jgi:hypothetical protein
MVGQPFATENAKALNALLPSLRGAAEAIQPAQVRNGIASLCSQ